MTAVGSPACAFRSRSARAASTSDLGRLSSWPASITTTPVAAAAGLSVPGEAGGVAGGFSAAGVGAWAGTGFTGWGACEQAARPARARAAMTQRLGASITVLQPHHVLELGRRDLDDVAAVLPGDHAVPGGRDDPVRVATAEDR